jgi:hypothetical protein
MIIFATIARVQQSQMCVYNMVTLNCIKENISWIFNRDLFEILIEQLRADSGNSAGYITLVTVEGESTTAGLC